MSGQSSYQHDPYQRSPHPPASEFKSSYDDDLIDDYATPYSANSKHQVFTLPKSPTSKTHHRVHSIPHSSKGTILSKSDETHDSAFSYPPPLPQKDEPALTLWQKIVPESIACRLYLATVLVETAVDLAIEGELFLRVREKEKLTGEGPNTTSRMSAYLAIFALAHVFQFVMAVDAVYARNTLQFICLAIFNVLFLIYAIIQIKEVQVAVLESTTGISSIPVKTLTTIIPIVIAVSEVAYIALGWKIYTEFGWKVYKFLGADRRIKKMYVDYQIYECLVKFDVFFWAGFSVQFIWVVLTREDWEYYVTCAALPLSILLLVEGHLAARYESRWMMATFMSGCVGAMVYFIYKLIKVLLYNTTDYRSVWKSLTVFSVIAIVLLIATFVYSIIILKNFGRGLKPALTRKAQGANQPHRRGPSATLNRMSIN